MFLCRKPDSGRHAQRLDSVMCPIQTDAGLLQRFTASADNRLALIVAGTLRRTIHGSHYAEPNRRFTHCSLPDHRLIIFYGE
jgi:hypothetical protein